MSKFRFHWGHGIAVFYGLFVIAILTIVVKSFSVDRSLVVDDYYQQDITYQSHKDKVNNAKFLENDLVMEYNKGDQLLRLKFPQVFNKISGKAWFYKPDNKKLDFEVKLEVDDQSEQLFQMEKLVGGVWVLKVDWEGDSKPFYKEFNIYK